MTTITQSITALPAVPDPASDTPSTFSTKAAAFVLAMKAEAVELETFRGQVNTVAGEVNTNASTATSQAANALAQATLAAASAAAAAASSNATIWATGTTYAIGDVRFSPINFLSYRRKTNGAGSADPSLDTTNWAAVAPAAGLSQVTVATTATTLTSTPTLLKFTPTTYGVPVILPDATTCAVGGPLHILDNRSAFPVPIRNNSMTLIGFVPPYTSCSISLDDKSSAAGVWSITGGVRLEASGSISGTTLANILNVIDIGANREILIGQDASSKLYGMIFDRSTGLSGSATLIRNAAVGNIAACLSGTNDVLIVSCTATTAMEAVLVTCGASGTVLTPNTAGTATLGANINAFAGTASEMGVLAVTGGFITSYSVATPACEVRGITLSGTTPSISAATALDGTAKGYIAATADKVIAVSTATTHLYTKPYTLSAGPTITAGTGTDTASGTMTLNKLAALGTRWYVGYNDGGSTVMGGVVSLSGTTTSITTATLFSAGVIQDAIVVGSNKVCVANNQTTNNHNILTDAAGTASAGTAITANASASRNYWYTSGTNVFSADGSTSAATTVFNLDCSGASPVIADQYSGNLTNVYLSNYAWSQPSDAMLRRPPYRIVGTDFCQTLAMGVNTGTYQLGVSKGIGFTVPRLSYGTTQGISPVRGRVASEVWTSNAISGFTKVECIA